MSISKKLVLAFIAVTGVVLIATLLLARWSFERGFLEYVVAVEKYRLERSADELSRLYLEGGESWDALTPRMFARAARPPERGSRPPPPRKGPRDDHSPPGGPPPGSLASLYDAEGQRLLGPDLSKRTHSGLIVVPIRLGSQQVGELRAAPQRVIDSPLATDFAQQQLNASWALAVFALLFSLFVSVFVSRLILAPVRQLQSAVNQLANGDFSYASNSLRADELGDLLRNVDRLALLLAQSQDTQRRWLVDISHELRTPVSVLTAELAAIQDGVRALRVEHLVSFEEELNRLNKLIEDLYQLSLADVGGLRHHFEPVDLGGCVEGALHSLQAVAQQGGLKAELQIDQTGYVSGDTARLHQLFINLISNSLAYTDTPGRLQLLVYRDITNQSPHLVVDVVDTSPSVPKEDCDRLFEPLYRQDASRSRRTEGAGLGLAICRRIVTAHQGTITAEPSVLGGLKVSVSLPEHLHV